MTFDRVAPYYDRLARFVFGRALEQAQVALTGQLPTGGRWLLLGGGTGWLLEQILHRCSPTEVLYIEASQPMLSQAEQRLRGHPHRSIVQFCHGTEASLHSDDRFDVILTPFVLDLFSEEWLDTHLIPRLLDTLRPTGYWLITDFVPTHVWWHRLLAKAMLSFFRLTAGVRISRLPDWPRLMRDRLALVADTQGVGGMVRSVLFTPFPETVEQSPRTAARRTTLPDQD